MGMFQWLEEFASRNQRGVIRRPDETGSPHVRRRFRFTGNVQGVGFRWEARLTAESLGLTGWVRNESDGTVTAEAEGADVCVCEFQRVMQAVPRFRITEVQTEEQPPSGTETSFQIRH